MAVENGTKVLMRPSHPHEGRTGIVKEQPGGALQMYLIEGDDAYGGGWYAMRRDFKVVSGGEEGHADSNG